MDSDFSTKAIGIAGLGLIGGSLARAFTKNGFPVFGTDKSEATVKAALRSHAVTEASADASVLSKSDIVFIALGPGDIFPFIKANRDIFSPGTIVIDCCGIKGPICKVMDEYSRNAGFIFIGGHPMAGTEKSGFEASDSDLFKGASFILTPRPDIERKTVDLAGEIIKRAGFSQIVVTTPQNHDRMIAFTSQLPHVLACAYVKSPCCPEHSGFSAGSFCDVSRVAHINASMWAQLFIGNRENLCAEIDGLLKNISDIRDAAAACDYGRLEALLQRAREIKDSVDSADRLPKYER